MKPVFADTSYFIAVLSEEDSFHDAAIHLTESLLGRMVVTEYVLIELGNALSRSKYRDRYVPFVRQLIVDPDTVFISASAGLFRDGMKLYAARPDQSWSMVDCLSFVVMKQRKLKEALTSDRHFIQAGFRALLREEVGR
jgi:predicted nucleic acid-binding protein